MDFNTSTLMMIFFIIFLILSIWKIYAFLPNIQLQDDDTTLQAQTKLLEIMKKIIKNNKDNLSNEELFLKMKEDEEFDEKVFWRFNLNKLNQLLLKHKLLEQA